MKQQNAYYTSVPRDETIFSEVVSLSSNGDVLASAHFCDAGNRGSVRVFKKVNSEWKTISPEFKGHEDDLYFGNDISLSGDARTLAISGDGTELIGGRVQVFRQNDNAQWFELGDEFTGEPGAHFGSAVCLSEDGNTLAIGERANEYGGRVVLYHWIDSAWVKLGDDIVGPQGVDDFGVSVSLAECGSIIAIGANGFSSGVKGVVRVYRYEQNNWKPVGDKLVGDSENYFGTSVSLCDSGTTLVVGSPGAHDGKGEVSLYILLENKWCQKGTFVSEEEMSSAMGNAVAISSDGSCFIAACSGYNDSRGAVYIFRLINSDWVRCMSTLYGSKEEEFFGVSVAMCSSGKRVACANYKKKSASFIEMESA